MRRIQMNSRQQGGAGFAAAADTTLEGADRVLPGPASTQSSNWAVWNDGWRLAPPDQAFIDPLPYTVTVEEQYGANI